MFERLDLGFERFRAIDGNELSEELITRINDRNQWPRPLIRAEIGCFLSHRACWETVASGIESFGAIFEDDMHISPDARSLLRSSAWIPQGVDLIKLETRNRAVTISRRSMKISADHRLARLFSFHDGLGGYIVSKQCAKWLCLQTEKAAAPVDQLILNPQFGIFGGLNVFQLIPSICIPDQVAARNGAATPAISSTIDRGGSLYASDRALLGQRGVRRGIGRMVGGLQRLLLGRRKIRVRYR